MSKNKSEIIPGRLIYVVGGSIGYASWMQGVLTNNMEKASIIIYTGGEDVTPKMYKRNAHSTTFSNIRRDAFEVEEFKRAIALKKPMLGICRGAQFLCVMAGGILVQDQSQSGGYHEMYKGKNEMVMVSSSHHQAQYPWGIDKNSFRILGWTTHESEYHYGETDDDELVIGKVEGGLEVEEAVYYNINALCMQHHPEYAFGNYNGSSSAEKYIEHCRNLLNEFVAGKL